MRGIGEGEGQVVPRRARGHWDPAERGFQQKRGVCLEGRGMGGRYVVAVRRRHVLTAVVAAFGGRWGHVRLRQDEGGVRPREGPLRNGALGEQGDAGGGRYRRSGQVSAR